MKERDGSIFHQTKPMIQPRLGMTADPIITDSEYKSVQRGGG